MINLQIPTVTDGFNHVQNDTCGNSTCGTSSQCVEARFNLWFHFGAAVPDFRMF